MMEGDDRSPDEGLGDYEERARELLGDHLLDSRVVLGEITLTIRRDAIVPVLKTLRDDAGLRLNQLIDLCGVDYPERDERFDVVYHLLGMSQNLRFRVKLSTSEGVPVPSVVDVFSAAGWWEREVWDLYGILFSGHPDLRRILTDYGFEGHPLRKDFPLTGYREVRYDDAQKRVVYEPVRLTQEFRNFDFLSPWEGAERIRAALPGDEKATPDSPAAQGKSDG